MHKLIKFIEAKHTKKDIPAFNVGDTVDVQLKIVEEGKSRLQSFEGIVIARSGSGVSETVAVRKISYGEGMELVFPLHSPSVDRINIVRKGEVRRAKLYYLKRKVGKETKVEERIKHAEGTVETADETPRPREEAK